MKLRWFECLRTDKTIKEQWIRSLQDPVYWLIALTVIALWVYVLTC